MRRLLLTGDWHLNDNPRDAYRWGAVEQIKLIAEGSNVTDIFILGDLTDFPDHHSAAFTNKVVDLLVRLSAGRCIHIIRGNHDASDPMIPFFRFVNAIESVAYLTQNTIWQSEGWRVLLVPYGCWPEQLPDGIHAVMTHETFAGAYAEHGTKLNGLRLPFTNIPIYSGDVHVPQQQGSVTYIGAPTAIRFGDTYSPRVLMLDVEGKVLSTCSIAVQGPTKKLVGVVADKDGVLLWAERTKVNKGDIVKVRVTFEGEIPSLAHLRADIAEGIERVGGTLYAIDVRDLPHTTSTPHQPVSRSDADLVRQYAKAHNFTQPTTDAGLAIVERKP